MFTKLALFSLLASMAIASPISPRQDTETPIEGKRIRSISNPELCLTVQAGYAAYGTNVEMTSCSQGQGGYLDQFQLFSATGPQRGQIKLVSKDYMCLDAGDVTNGGGITIEACEDNKDSQIFTVGTTGTGSEPNLRLAVGQAESQCLDVEKDSSPDLYRKPYGYTKALQTWECHPLDHPDAAQQYFELVSPEPEQE